MPNIDHHKFYKHGTYRVFNFCTELMQIIQNHFIDILHSSRGLRY